MTRTRGVTAGLSISDSRVTLVWYVGVGGPPEWKCADAQYSGADDLAPSIRALVAAAPPIESLHVTLLRPVAHSRSVALPAMNRDDAERIFARDWKRHVVASNDDARVVTAERADRGRWRAVFAPARVLDTINALATEHGWSAVHVRSADDVMAGAVRTLSPADARLPEAIALTCDSSGPLDAVHLRAGSPWAGRQFLPGATDDDAITFAREGTPLGTPVIIIGGGVRASELARSLGAAGIRARVAELRLPATCASREHMLATLGTMSVPLMPLRAEAVRLVVARQSRRITRWLVVATVAALVLAFMTERLRVQRELDAIAEARANILEPVAAALFMRRDLESTTDLAIALADRERRASRVTGLLSAIALALPDGTVLSSARVAGDSVTVEGESKRSADVYQALRELPSLEQVRLAAPLRQERLSSSEGTTVEHFAFAARIRAPGK